MCRLFFCIATFPEPLGPTMATRLPVSTLNRKPWKSGFAPGQPKPASSTAMLGTSESGSFSVNATLYSAGLVKSDERPLLLLPPSSPCAPQEMRAQKYNPRHTPGQVTTKGDGGKEAMA